MKNLQGLKVLVLGLGDSGLAMAAWVQRCGGQARVWDSREQPPQLERCGTALACACVFVCVCVRARARV